MDIVLDWLNLRPQADWPWTLHPEDLDWSVDTALTMANLATLAYSDFKHIEASLSESEYGFSPITPCAQPNPHPVADAFLAVRPDVIVVAFRGTEPTNPRDYLTDFNASQVPFDLGIDNAAWGLIHAGWVDAARPLIENISTDLASLAGVKDRKLWLTGHSMGGALAMLAAAALKSRNCPVEIGGVYTFGQPAVGDPTFQERYDAELGPITFRCVNDRDPVPQVPPGELTMIEETVFSQRNLTEKARRIFSRTPTSRYAHAGQLRLLLPDGSISSDPREAEIRRLGFLARTAAQRLSPVAILWDLPKTIIQFPEALLDHLPIRPSTEAKWHAGYIDRLKALQRLAGSPGAHR